MWGFYGNADIQIERYPFKTQGNPRLTATPDCVSCVALRLRFRSSNDERVYRYRGARMAAEAVTTIKTSEIPDGAIVALDVRGTRIAVANVGGTYYAFDDACTHEQCSLTEMGELAGTTVTCSCHGSEFDVSTGKVLAPPATVPVKVYATRVEGDALHIDI
jgi:3-phenylpropionate/trans-cinnamate dioxygenase ferredoxin subunit